MEKKIDFEKIEKSAKYQNVLVKSIVYVLLTLWAVIVLFPFYWMILTSVKGYSAYTAERVPKFVTLSPTVQNYIDAFTTVPLAQYFINTLIFII